MRRRATLLRSAGGAAAIVIAFACGPSRLPSPPLTEQPTSALVPVPYPPPPARVETVPRRPRDRGAVWIDGEWTWRTRRWAWRPGRWVKPPPGARFAPWTTVRDRTGRLYIANGAWRDAAGAEVEEPEPLASAGPMPAVVVTPEGEEVKRAPDAPLDGGSLDGSAEAGDRNGGSLDGSASDGDRNGGSLDGSASDGDRNGGSLDGSAEAGDRDGGSLDGSAEAGEAGAAEL